MKITVKSLFLGLGVLVILAATFIWLAFNVWHLFNIANIVVGGN